MRLGVFFLTTGRVFVGMAAGISNVTYGKFIGENLPGEQATKYMMVQSANISIGIFASFLLGGCLPDPDDF